MEIQTPVVSQLSLEALGEGEMIPRKCAKWEEGQLLSEQHQVLHISQFLVQCH